MPSISWCTAWTGRCFASHSGLPARSRRRGLSIAKTMLRLYAGLTAPRLECSLCLCACRIAANLCLDYLDRERARAVEGRPSRGISSVFTKLSPRERIVFELRHYQGLDLRTVSKVLDTTEEIARNVWFRAWHKLSAALASDVASNKS